MKDKNMKGISQKPSGKEYKVKQQYTINAPHSARNVRVNACMKT
jgi:hypothetical protein